MSIILLANTVWGSASQLLVTDTSNAATTDQAGIYTVTGTSRHLSWQSGATADRRIVYINKAGTLSCTHMVLTRADRHNTHQVIIRSYSTYSSSTTAEYTSAASFAETLVGAGSTDWVKAITISSKQALGIDLLAGTGGLYTKYVHSLYFCNALTFDYPESVQLAPLPMWTRVPIKHQSYLVNEQQTYVFNSLTRAEVLAFDQIYRLRENPVFLYDSAGTLIPDKLVHGLIVDRTIVRQFHDLYAIQVQFVTLRRWT
jgi:hypothetical protein